MTAPAIDVCQGASDAAGVHVLSKYALGELLGLVCGRAATAEPRALSRRACPGPVGCGVGGEHDGELLSRQWSAEVEALREGGAPVGNGAKRRFVFDALGHDAHFKPPTESGDRFGDRGIGGVAERVVDEAAVDLELVDGQLFEQAEEE